MKNHLLTLAFFCFSLSVHAQISNKNDSTNLNLIKNGDFTNGLTDWNYWANSIPQGQVDPVVENGVILMTTGLDPDAYYWNYQLNQTGFKAEPNVEYFVSFRSWSSKIRSNVLVFEDAQNNYNRYGQSDDPQSIEGRSEWIYYTSTEPKWYTFHVVFDQIKPNTVQKIQWMLATADATTYLDDIILAKDESCILEPNKPLVFLWEKQVNMPVTESSAKVSISSNVNWKVHSDQAWLSVYPEIGTGDETLTLRALANPLHTTRTATLTVSSPGVEFQTITVSQGTITGIEPLSNVNGLTIYPNPTSGVVKLIFDYLPPYENSLTVIDINGRTVLKRPIENKAEWINLSGNEPGIYIIKTTLKDAKVQKLILK
jgi:hypothetical protein